MPTLIIWSFFEPRPWTYLLEKVDFWTEDKYSFKSFQSNQYVRKRLLRHFSGLPWDQGQRNTLQKMKSV